MNLEGLPGWAVGMVEEARVARLGLLDEEARPRVLPVTFVPFEDALWSAIDHKPKRATRASSRISGAQAGSPSRFIGRI